MRGFEVASVDPVDGRPDDAVIDFEITANRPDCLSVLGHGARSGRQVRRARLRVAGLGLRPSAFEARTRPGTRYPAPPRLRHGR